MNKKVEKLKSILENANLVPLGNGLWSDVSFGFRPEVYDKITQEKTEIEFNNIDEAVSVIKESIKITNRTDAQIKEDISAICDASGINPAKNFVIRFLTT